MRIEAGPVSLRPLHDGDVQALVAGLCDPEIARWLPNIPQPYSAADARAFIAAAQTWRRTGGEASFAIADPDDTCIGVAGVRPSERPPAVGYWVAAAARGRGIASAATSALTGWAFHTFGCERIGLHAEVANEASCRVAEKCGFVRVSGETRMEPDGRVLQVFELRRAP
jgi:RimJ/RimL family protein N-acetyltransferase